MRYVPLMMVLGLIILSTGCVPAFPWDSFEQRLEAVKESNPMGCTYLKGGGNPPASRIDGGIIAGWGEHMTPDTFAACLQQLKQLPN